MSVPQLAIPDRNDRTHLYVPTKTGRCAVCGQDEKHRAHGVTGDEVLLTADVDGKVHRGRRVVDGIKPAHRLEKYSVLGPNNAAALKAIRTPSLCGSLSCFAAERERRGDLAAPSAVALPTPIRETHSTVETLPGAAFAPDPDPEPPAVVEPRTLPAAVPEAPPQELQAPAAAEASVGSPWPNAEQAAHLLDVHLEELFAQRSYGPGEGIAFRQALVASLAHSGLAVAVDRA